MRAQAPLEQTAGWLEVEQFHHLEVAVVVERWLEGQV
jgi:hypothetical protein